MALTRCSRITQRRDPSPCDLHFRAPVAGEASAFSAQIHNMKMLGYSATEDNRGETYFGFGLVLEQASR